ncbi:glycosyl hydrolase [Dyadobacter jiangsuensis]|uniref:Glycosyl hydrolase family 26 n=1 Tax=Dyadobacter jiangsuensis TaxID=1591085 RepID=A0A2P8G1J8_9BACT|nr:glycosyl hydrolase [Dyadobacter jiangsuensis]PSL27849.1 glycosyl hydrolase family 26 [Dyadobacter jiangsuensis]
MKRLLISLLGALLCTAAANAQIDTKATPETTALYRNLKKLSEQHILFGHQHATEYGHGWSGDEERSDVKSITGSHPAVIGVDFMGLSGRPAEEITKTAEALRKNVVATYNRGGITTVAWHFSNPASEGGFYWKDGVSKPAMALIKPGGSHHEQYKLILKNNRRFCTFGQRQGRHARANDIQAIP